MQPLRGCLLPSDPTVWGSEFINKEGAVEIRVDSVDYKSPTKKDEPGKEKVEVNSDSGDKAGNYANPGEALSSQVDHSSRSKFVPNKLND
ncbi:hypothetical protein OSB04_005337 [Centaurea solstitialis]|uniref:Uncharacterized protein n=1 Tax=Centaurea solstitialis TaxID=347529 RepID=A0AA38WGP1_9ASTR|nr:hypothetical protein OSB04_005337 [Centaurea solstitialis]